MGSRAAAGSSLLLNDVCRRILHAREKFFCGIATELLLPLWRAKWLGADKDNS